MSRLTLIELKFGSQTTSSTVRRPRSSAHAEGDLTRWFPQCGVRPAYRQSRLEPRLVTVPGRTQTESEPHPRTGGAAAKRASAGHLDRVWPDTGPNGTVFEPRKGCADTSLPAMGRLRRGGAGPDGSARSTHDSTPGSARCAEPGVRVECGAEGTRTPDPLHAMRKIVPSVRAGQAANPGLTCTNANS